MPTTGEAKSKFGRQWRIAALRVNFARFLRDRSGDVAMIFGLMAIAMFLAMGAALDFGRWLHARNQTMSAIDAAVLAGGRALQLDPADNSGAVAAAEAFYKENVKTRLELTSDTVAFAPGSDGLSFTASGNAYIATPFLSLVSIETLPLISNSGSDYSTAKLAAGGNAETNLEIAMMLDVTGSMAGSKIEDLKEAASELVNIVVWDDQSEYTSRVALVPFADSVRPPQTMLTSVRGSLPATFSKWYYHNRYGWYSVTMRLTPCVAERTGSEAYTDAEPGSGQYVMGVYNTSGNCTLTTNNEIVPLTSNKTALVNAIDGMDVGGGTAGHLGTAWAWYMLSPDWNAVWPSSDSHAASYGTTNTDKVAILMTDGEYNTQYGSDGVSASASSAANGSSTAQARSLCDAMKSAGITVYTVGFGLSSGSTAEMTLNLCATDSSKAFTADDGDELKQAFRAIALQISQLYLSN